MRIISDIQVEVYFLTMIHDILKWFAFKLELHLEYDRVFR